MSGYYGERPYEGWTMDEDSWYHHQRLDTRPDERSLMEDRP